MSTQTPFVQLVIKNPKFKGLLAQSRAHGDGALALFIASGAKELRKCLRQGRQSTVHRKLKEDLDHHQLSWIARSLVDFPSGQRTGICLSARLCGPVSAQTLYSIGIWKRSVLAAASSPSALRGGEQRQYSSSAFAYHRNADWGNVDELLACKIMCWGAETTKKNRLG